VAQGRSQRREKERLEVGDEQSPLLGCRLKRARGMCPSPWSGPRLAPLAFCLRQRSAARTLNLSTHLRRQQNLFGLQGAASRGSSRVDRRLLRGLRVTVARQ
jgi:hypothetical protein